MDKKKFEATFFFLIFFGHIACRVYHVIKMFFLDFPSKMKFTVRRRISVCLLSYEKTTKRI